MEITSTWLPVPSMFRKYECGSVRRPKALFRLKCLLHTLNTPSPFVAPRREVTCLKKKAKVFTLLERPDPPNTLTSVGFVQTEMLHTLNTITPICSVRN